MYRLHGWIISLTLSILLVGQVSGNRICEAHSPKTGPGFEHTPEIIADLNPTSIFKGLRRPAGKIIVLLNYPFFKQGVFEWGREPQVVVNNRPGVTWLRMVKMDEGETSASFKIEPTMMVIWLFLFIILGLILFFLFLRRRRKVHHEELSSTRKALRESEEKYRVALKSIGDAVITTDIFGKVQFMNPIAETLTGWSIKNAYGKSLPEVFKIFEEDTGDVTENPVSKVIESGKVIELSNHTLLKSADGREIPIADSGAPIRDENNNVTGVVLVFRDQTTERESRRRLIESEQKYRALFENMLDGFALHDIIFNENGRPVDYIFREVNNAFESLTSLKKEQVTGKRVSVVLPGIADDPADWIGRYGRLVQTGAEERFELYSETLGRWYYVIAFKTAEQQFATIFQDITNRKQAEIALFESERKFKTLVKNLPGMAYRCYNLPDWPMEFCSGGSETLTGYDPEELTENNPTLYGTLIHPDDKKMVWDITQNAVAAQDDFSLEYRIFTKTGQMKWVAEKGQAVPNDGAQEIMLEGLISDISPLKEAERISKEREMHWRTLVDTIPDMVWLKSPDGKYLSCNHEFEKFFGSTESGIIGKTDHEFVDKELADFFRQQDREAISGNGPVINEEEVIYASGGQKASLETIKSPMYDSKGNLIGVLGIARNITRRKEAEQELRKHSAGIEQSPASIMITDKRGVIEYINPKFCEISGYSKEEVVGQNANLLKSGEHPESYHDEVWKTILAGRVWKGEFINRKKNGDLFWEEATIGPILSNEGEITHFIGINVDMTQRKDLEQQLQQSQKLEAIGQLAGGVAHDFNNLLTVINGYSSLLLNELDSKNKIYKEIEQIAKAGEKAGALTRQLLVFSRKQIIQLKTLNLNEVVRDMEKILGRIIGEDIQIKIKLDYDLGYTRADIGQMNQVIMNLAVNSRDAMPYGGMLSIETQNVVIDSEYSARHLNLNPGKYVVLSIVDDGLGMTKETQNHIFEPFFTTKKAGKGTGLGLSTVYGIIKQHNGHIWLYSEINKGTTFRIYLPQVAKVKSEIEDKPTAKLFIGTERILCVEDDPVVLNLAKAILETHGYKITTARGGSQALNKIKQLNEKIDLLITDVVMPGMGGKILSDKIKKLVPGIKTIFISGYTDDALARSGILQKGIKFLQKPFTPAGLLSLVRETLDTDEVQ